MVKFYKRLRPLLGTYVEIGIDPQISDPEKIVTRAFRAIEKVHQLLSFHDSKSDLSSLNQSSLKFVELNPLSIEVLKKAQAMTKASGGLFNFTVGGTLVRSGFLPVHQRNEFLDAGDFSDLELNGRKARLKKPVRITLDGIAKGFAVDLAVQTLKKAGVTSGYVNAGGDVRIFGSAQVPLYLRNNHGSLEKLGLFSNTAIATSHNSKKKNPRFPGHIVSTTKKPILNGTWTVLAKSAWKADALTKVASQIADPAERDRILKKLGGRLLESNVSKKP